MLGPINIRCPGRQEEFVLSWGAKVHQTGQLTDLHILLSTQEEVLGCLGHFSREFLKLRIKNYKIYKYTPVCG